MTKASANPVFKVPNTLKAKIGNAPGPDLDQIVAEAEKALDGMREQSRGWLQDYFDAFSAAMEDFQAGKVPGSEAIERIRKTAHEIKGQGTTFGYPLLTAVGHRLQTWIERDPQAAARHPEVAAAHIDFMRLVFNGGIHDLGGAKEAELIAALDDAVGKISEV